jgi:RNA polymerase-binding transcription factor DksA
MNRAMRDLYRRELENMRNRIAEDLRQIRSEALYEGTRPSREGHDIPGDTGDIARGRSFEEVSIAITENEQSMLAHVTGAMKRLDSGTFGLCRGCCRAIPAARLRAVPYTPWCHTCAVAEEAPVFHS